MVNAHDKIDALLDRAVRLHSAPTIALRVVEITRDPDFEIIELVTCLEHDPALAASILRLVNASYFGLSHRVSSIRQAVAYLGRRSLRLAVISFGMVRTLTRSTPAQLYEAYWRRSLTMACAGRLCADLADSDTDEAYSAGLLADLGMLVMAQTYPKQYVPLAMEHVYGNELVEQERAVFGFDHASVTARLITRWGFPNELADAVADHHELPHCVTGPAHVVSVANLFAEALWSPQSGCMPTLQETLWEDMECGLDQLIELALACKQFVTESAEVFQVQLSGEIDVDAVRQEAYCQFEKNAIAATLELESLEAMMRDHSV